ncbi:MAG: hypothetical protein KJ000_35355 [Pirellulaceae bacterium]|nr:hypothetical protein [Pirellulaceae bacterium]
MPVRCANCGEELLGAVNRCWRCGTKIASHWGEPDLPPVRQSPIAEPDDTAARDSTDVAEPGSGVAASSEDEVYDAQLSAASQPPESAPSSQPARRVGSPFAGTPTRLRRDADQSDTGRPVRLPGQWAAAGGAVAALVLGVLSLAASFFSVGALFLAMAGLPVGIWGLFSDRRGQAIVGMLLCCIALAISGFQAAALLYQLRYGVAPWETPTSF